MSGPTFGEYDGMDPDKLKQEQSKLRDNISNNRAGIIARTNDIGWGVTAGAGVGAVAAAGTFALQNKGLIQNVAADAKINVELMKLGKKLGTKNLLTESQIYEKGAKTILDHGKGKLAIAVGAVVALGSALYVGSKMWKKSSIAQNEKDSIRLGHVERVLKEREQPRLNGPEVPAR